VLKVAFHAIGRPAVLIGRGVLAVDADRLGEILDGAVVVAFVAIDQPALIEALGLLVNTG